MQLDWASEWNVVAWTFNPTPERAREYGVEFLELDELLRRSDVVSLHVALTPSSAGMIGREQLAMMKPTAILVNVARGAVVDEAALLETLEQGAIAGAGLDVFQVEPLPSGHPLTKLDNVVLAPHAGSMAYNGTMRGLEMSIENLEQFAGPSRLTWSPGHPHLAMFPYAAWPGYWTAGCRNHSRPAQWRLHELLESLERQFNLLSPCPRSKALPQTGESPSITSTLTPATAIRSTGGSYPAPSGDAPAQTKASADVTLLWFHGNAATLGIGGTDLALFHHLLGVNVLIFDLPGLWQQPGRAV